MHLSALPLMSRILVVSGGVLLCGDFFHLQRCKDASTLDSLLLSAGSLECSHPNVQFFVSANAFSGNIFIRVKRGLH